MLEFPQRVLHPNDLFALRYVHDARLAPDGRRVAYVTSRTVEELGEEYIELVIGDLDGGIEHELRFPGRVASPRWSPEGSRLAFIGTQGGSSRIYLADAKYGISALTQENCDVQGPFSWSPDGSTIAYTTITNHSST